MSKTQENLKAAFAGESQANRKYLAFAEVAEKEGRNNLAKLFRAVAEGETIHALKHLSVLEAVKSSAENLRDAIAGETYEIETMYPEFIGLATEENEKVAEKSFFRANEVEKTHQKKFNDALAEIESGKDITQQKYFVCQVCGQLELDEAPEHCPICNAPASSFNAVE